MKSYCFYFYQTIIDKHSSYFVCPAFYVIDRVDIVAFFLCFYALFWRAQFKITDLRYVQIIFGEFDGLYEYFFPLAACIAC